MTKFKPKKFTSSELDFIKANYGTIPIPDIAFILGRTEYSIRCKLYALKYPEKERERNKKNKQKQRAADKKRLGGKRHYDYWTLEEIAVIFFSGLTDTQMAKVLHRTLEAVNSMKKRMRRQRDKLVEAKNRWNEIKDDYKQYLRKPVP